MLSLKNFFVWMVGVQLILFMQKVTVFATIAGSTNYETGLTMGWL